VSVDPGVSRRIWHDLEPINAVTYFCPESREAFSHLGLRGFWMGYFAARAAPMGPVDAGVVEATFFNFHPARVRRAVPDAWSHADPGAVVAVRAEAAAASLRRLLGGAGALRACASLRPLLDAAVDRADPAGKPLCAGNLEVDTPDDPVAALWQAATTLREHRGDCHVALLMASDLRAVEALALFSAAEGFDPGLFMDSRGWSRDEWGVAVDALRSRGLVSPGGDATDRGRTLRAEIEANTDELAGQPYRALPTEQRDVLVSSLREASRPLLWSGEIPFPNPIGLPRSGR
jgi:hypothetical protein